MSDQKVEEMATNILEFVKGREPVTYTELLRHLGEEARGEFAVGLPKFKNIWFWDGVSETFVNAMDSLNGKLFEEPCSWFIYAMTGRV